MAKSHKTVPFDPAAHLAKSLKNPAFKAAYDALEDEFSAFDALLLARIESSLGSRKHSPSLATLRRYAEACGEKLTIQIG